MRLKVFLLLLAVLWIGAVSASPKGALCLTFDDRFLENWEKAIPLFQKYNARATFFIYGRIDGPVIASLKKLQDAGHSIGLHGVKHRRAVNYIKERGMEEYMKNEIMPQLDICRKNGINVRSFAYPYSQRTIESDKKLFEKFDFLRTNCSAVKKNGQTLAAADGCFVKKVDKKQLFYGFPASGKFDMEEVKAAMTRVAKENSVLVFYAHNITEKLPRSHHISISQLTELLIFAEKLGIAVCGMNEL